VIAARRAGPLATLGLALAGLPGCATTLMHAGSDLGDHTHFLGTIVDVLGCCLILPLPLCLPDLPLSFLADTVIWLVDDRDYWDEHPRPVEAPPASPEASGGR
jgi:hypothetical protein